MKIDAWVITDKGLRRESNQDSCALDPQKGYFVVADGMGGHSGGEVASNLAVTSVQEVMSDPEAFEQSPRELIAKCYEVANQRIYETASREKPELAGMGTTMVLAYLRGTHIYIGNVGDSRCYLYKKPYLWQVTEDHSLVNEQIRAGVLTEEQARAQGGRNVITRSVGYEREVYPDIIERQVQSGEIYLLCSDGLSNMVGDDKMSDIITHNAPDKIARVLIEHALANGGDDNVSVLILHIVSVV